MLVKPTNKASSTGVPTLSTPYSATSLSTDPDRFYPAQQRLRSRWGLTEGVQGKAVRTEFSIVGKEDMGIRRRDTITYTIIASSNSIRTSQHYSMNIITHSASNSYRNTDCINIKARDRINIAERDWITSILCHCNKVESKHQNRFIIKGKVWAIFIISY